MVVLHQDVLEAVCEALDNYFDLRSFSLTCSTLRPAAARCLLTLKPIVLTNETVHTFHGFVFADPKARGRHIRGIEAAAWSNSTSNEPDVDLATYFIEIIESATHLQHLTLRNLDASYLGDTRIISTISRLPTLVDLCLVNCETSGDDLLRAIISPIRTLRVLYHIPSPLNSMVHLASTLESIKLWDMPFHVVAAPGTRFPAVHSLTACVVWGIPRLENLLYMFPSLSRTLSVSLFSPFDNFDLYALREANKRAQDAAGKDKWKNLDYVYCFPILLFALNLQCPIRRLALNCSNGKLKQSFISPILRTAQPQYLELLELNIAVPVVLSEISGDLFPPEAQATITHLLLHIEYRPSSDPTTTSGKQSVTLWETLVNNLCSTVRALRSLKYLSLIIDCFIPPNVGHAEDEFIRTVGYGDREYHLAAEEIAAAAAPSLKNIILTNTGQTESGHSRQESPWHGQRGWSLNSRGESDNVGVGADAGCSWRVEALSGEELMLVWRREDLIGSKSR